MAYRWSGFDQTRSLAGRASFLGLVTLAIVTIACSGDERRITIGAGENEIDAGSAPPPRFEPAEDGGDASAVDPSVPAVAMCVATECPFPFGTCTGGNLQSSYVCGTNLQSDRNNCGACGNVCPGSSAFPELNMDTQCVDGTCQRQCVPRGNAQFADCNGLVDDGCETNITTNPNHCGACGNACAPGPGGERLCISGQCGCPTGETWCGAGCTDTRVDDLNCGACGNACEGTDAGPPPPHMQYRCQRGKCAQLKCDDGWADCNGVIPGDGCEVDIVTDRNNCGACGNVCPAGQKCIVRGNTVGCGCEPLETLCTDPSGKEFCADLLHDTRNCGACGYVCPTKGDYAATCAKGFCEYECPPGRGDCDGDSRNGCETNLLANGRHCGACGNQCDTAAGQPCISGKCLMVECDGGTVTK